MSAPTDLRLVFWELTARCNLKCCHCRAEAQDDFAPGELSTREIIDAARAIRETADPIVVLTGGEPLVRGDFFDIVRACTGLFSRVVLATNGTTVDDETARRIVAGGIRRVSLSLDGSTAATHDAFRGVPGSFDRTLRGYDALARAGASLQINATLTKRNLGEIEDLLNLALEKRADAFHVFALVPVGCGARIGEEARLSPRQMEEFLRWLFVKSTELRDRLHIRATCAPQYYRIMREESRGRGIEPTGQGQGGQAHAEGMHAMTRGCLAGSAVCFVSRSGDVQPCGYLPLRAGNLREGGFGEIWRDSELFSALRDPGRLGGSCGSCGSRMLCAGCRARAYAATSDYLAEDPDCFYNLER